MMLVAVLCFLDLLEASVLVLLFDDPVIGVTMILGSTKGMEKAPNTDSKPNHISYLSEILVSGFD